MSESGEYKRIIWKKNTEQAKFLYTLLESGEAFRTKPIQLYKKYPLFNKCVTDQTFRSQLNKAKSAFNKTNSTGVPAPTNVPEEPDDVPNHLLTGDGENYETRTTSTDDVNIEDCLDVDIAVGSKRKSSSNINENSPQKKRPTWNLAVTANWADSVTMMEFVDTFFLLPSSVTGNSQYSMHVDESGGGIITQFFWPPAISTVEILSKIAQNNDPEITKHHPLIGAIMKFLMQLKENINDGVVQEYETELPIKVQHNVIFIKSCQLMDGSKIIHIHLQGITYNFANQTRDERQIKKVNF